MYSTLIYRPSLRINELSSLITRLVYNFRITAQLQKKIEKTIEVFKLIPWQPKMVRDKKLTLADVEILTT